MGEKVQEIKPGIMDQHGRTGGGSGDGGHLDSRIAKLESDVGHIQNDIHEIKDDLRTILKGGIAAFVITWTGLIAATVGLAYLMAKGFHWL